MKAKLPILILLACAVGVNADIIDLTPGGFSILNPPQVYVDWEADFFAGLYHGLAFLTSTGWRSDFLGEPLFHATPVGATDITISWDLTGTRFAVEYLFTGTGPNFWVNMYQITGSDRIVGSGLFTIDGNFPITASGIYGTGIIHTPDAGNTLVMLFIALVLLFGATRLRSLRG